MSSITCDFLSSTCLLLFLLLLSAHLFPFDGHMSASADATAVPSPSPPSGHEAESVLGKVASSAIDGSMNTTTAINNTITSSSSSSPSVGNQQLLTDGNSSANSMAGSLDCPFGFCVNGSTNSTGKCRHYFSNGTCNSRNHEPNSLSALLEALPFLPILIVLGTMFVCLCLVLRLFSKARFRNERRSIFVNPQTLSVAQAQERRLSQLSQLSGSGLRSLRSTPRTPHRGSPIASVRSARGSFASAVYPIAVHGAADHSLTLHAPNSVLMKEKSRSNSISSSKLLP